MHKNIQFKVIYSLLLDAEHFRTGVVVNWAKKRNMKSNYGVHSVFKHYSEATQGIWDPS